MGEVTLVGEETVESGSVPVTGSPGQGPVLLGGEGGAGIPRCPWQERWGNAAIHKIVSVFSIILTHMVGLALFVTKTIV